MEGVGTGEVGTGVVGRVVGVGKGVRVGSGEQNCSWMISPLRHLKPSSTSEKLGTVLLQVA